MEKWLRTLSEGKQERSTITREDEGQGRRESRVRLNQCKSLLSTISNQWTSWALVLSHEPRVMYLEFAL